VAAATGRILSAPAVVGELSFDAAADRIDPVTRAIGLPAALPSPIVASGMLKVDERLASVRLSTLRVGGSAGAGEVVFPLDSGATPRMQLALTHLNLDEWQARACPTWISRSRPTA
jgi:hypothetical protein